MIHFIVQRIANKLAAKKSLLLLSFIPPLFYIAFSSSKPEMYYIYQDFAVTMDSPFAVSSSPVETTSINALLRNPDNFFLDRFALKRAAAILNESSRNARRTFSPVMVQQAVKNAMILSANTDSTVRIGSRTSNPSIGKNLVGFYAARLLAKSEEGLRRAFNKKKRALALVEQKLQILAADSGQLNDFEKQTTQTLKPPSAAKAEIKSERARLTDEISRLKTYVPASLSGDMHIQEQKMIFTAKRIPSLLATMLVSLMLIILYICILEFLDSSFKSERQVSRYLELPTLGSLPDMKKVFISK